MLFRNAELRYGSLFDVLNREVFKLRKLLLTVQMTTKSLPLLLLLLLRLRTVKMSTITRKMAMTTENPAMMNFLENVSVLFPV